MDIHFIEIDHIKMALIESGEFKITTAQDAVELLMTCRFSGTNRLIIYEKSLEPEFFNLKTGIAGAILQKFSNYDGYLSIIGSFAKYKSRSLNSFIYESNQQGRVNFVSSKEEGIQALLPRFI